MPVPLRRNACAGAVAAGLRAALVRFLLTGGIVPVVVVVVLVLAVS